MAAAGWHPTRQLAGSDGLRAMIVAQSLVAAVVFATVLPVMRRMEGRPPADGFRVAMLASAVRFVVTVPLLAIIAWRGRVHVVAFLVWGATAYVVMVLLEAVVLAKWVKHLESERRC